MFPTAHAAKTAAGLLPEEFPRHANAGPPRRRVEAEALLGAVDLDVGDEVAGNVEQNVGMGGVVDRDGCNDVLPDHFLVPAVRARRDGAVQQGG